MATFLGGCFMTEVTITAEDKKGFTLIEVLLVIAIIGILAAVATPQYAAYRQRCYRAVLESDAHSYANAQAAYFANHDTYCSNLATLQNSTYGVGNSPDTVPHIVNANNTSFEMTFTNNRHGIVVTYNSAAGGIQ
jgi:type IV pilus assembly protein PilA